MDMCTCLSQIILHSVFCKHPFKITICWGLGKIYPWECPRMLPDSIFWTTCHYLITFHKHPSDCDFYDNKFPTPLFNMPIQSSCLIKCFKQARCTEWEVPIESLIIKPFAEYGHMAQKTPCRMAYNTLGQEKQRASILSFHGPLHCLSSLKVFLVPCNYSLLLFGILQMVYCAYILGTND